MQELYEKKLVTYPRTDARVLSSAVAKEIGRNISGLQSFGPAKGFAQEVLAAGSYKTIAKTRYVNDKQITDHYAIIPTGQGFGALASLSKTAYGVYATVVRRFLSIFYPPAEFSKVTMVTGMGSERFFYSFRVLLKEGYFKVAGNPYEKKKKPDASEENTGENAGNPAESSFGLEFLDVLNRLKKGMELPVQGLADPGGRDVPAEALQFRFHDSGDGKCRTADRGRGAAGTDQELRHRYECDARRDIEEARRQQIHRIK